MPWHVYWQISTILTANCKCDTKWACVEDVNRDVRVTCFSWVQLFDHWISILKCMQYLGTINIFLVTHDAYSSTVKRNCPCTLVYDYTTSFCFHKIVFSALSSFLVIIHSHPCVEYLGILVCNWSRGTSMAD